MAAEAAIRKSGQGRATSCTDAPEQALRPECDDKNHRQEQDDIGQFRKKGGAERIDEANNKTAQHCAEQTANSAKKNDEHRQRKHVGVQTWVAPKDRAA